MKLSAWLLQQTNNKKKGNVHFSTCSKPRVICCENFIKLKIVGQLSKRKLNGRQRALGNIQLKTSHQQLLSRAHCSQ